MKFANRKSITAIALCTVLTLLLARPAQAQTFTVLHDFTGPDGAFPHGALLLDPTGNLYGVTTYLVQVVNACIIVLKASSGAKVSGYPKSLNTFFGAPAADGLGDSRTAYDSLENRFIVTVVGGRTSRFEEAS